MWQEKFYLILTRLIVRLFGFLSCLLAILILLALFSFNPNDVSFNTSSTNEVVTNWMGIFGSHISDLLFQLIGLSAFLCCLILFSWGIKAAGKRGIDYFAIKLILAPFCLLAFSVFFALIPEPDWWVFNSLGGVNGKFILSKINFLPHFASFLLSFILSILLLSIVIEISISDWKYFIRYSAITMVYLGRITLSGLIRLRHKFKLIRIAFINYLNKENPHKLLFDNYKENLEKTKELDPVVAQEKKEKRTRTFNKTRQIIRSLEGSSGYQLPSTNLLVDRSAENKDKKTSQVQLDQQAKMLAKVLKDFGINGTSLGIKLGPIITLHEFEPAAGTKAARIISLSDDIARSMSAVSARIAVIPGNNAIGIEIPNLKREVIFLRELLESDEYKYTQASLPIILGKDIGGKPIIVDLAKMPHLLVAGTTGSGKSVGVNAMILSLLYKLPPDECKFIMIDPKMLELSVYDGIPHLLAPVVTEPGRAVTALKWVVNEMEERYRLMSNVNVRNIATFNEKIDRIVKNGEKITKKVQTGFDAESGEPIVEEIEIDAKRLPFIVVIVDEMADLMLVAGKDIEGSIQRLAQMARAAGIHIIMATQRPSVDVITGVIKANFPTRISFQVTSKIDSRTILGTQGGEQLLGNGDMIYMSGGSKLTRVHGPFCSDSEVEKIVGFIKNQKFVDEGYSQNEVFEQIEAMQNASDSSSDSNSDFSGDDGDLYNKAVMIVKRDKKPSISYVQRQLRIGYNRAANLIERMEKEGVVTAPNVAGKREIIE